MGSDQEYLLLIKYLSKSTNEEENRSLLNWLNKNSENQKLFNECKDIYLSVGAQHVEGRYAETKKWEAVKNRINRFQSDKKKRFLPNRNSIKIAAAVVFALFAGFMIHYLTSVPDKNAPWYEVQASMGSTSRIQLADGSIVWLNAGSKLKLAPDFNQKSRDVYLEGEAYFDIKKREKKHFIVHTSDIFIKVLGTQFNVKSYSDENIIETTLEEGSIQIFETNKGSHQLLTLKPKQKATYIKEKGEILTTNIKSKVEDILNKNEKIEYRKANVIIAGQVNTPDYTAWKEGQLIFKSEPLGEIMKTLERKFDVKVISDDSQLNERLITANFKNESIEQVMHALQLTSLFNYKIEKDSIYIYAGSDN